MKKKGWKFILLAHFVVYPLSASDLTQILFKIERQEKKMKTLSFSFEQNMIFSETGIKDRVEGNAFFTKPNKMRIEKTHPRIQTTITNGDKVWIYTPSYNQAWVGSWSDWSRGPLVPKGMLPWQNYVTELKKSFDLSLVEGDVGRKFDGVVLKAVPKNQSAGYELELDISTETWLPQRTLFVSGSAKIETVLSDIEMNPKIKKDIFQFEPPSGTDIIPLN